MDEPISSMCANLPFTPCLSRSRFSLRGSVLLLPLAVTALALTGCASASRPVSRATPSDQPKVPPLQRLDFRDLPANPEQPKTIPSPEDPDQVIRFAHALAGTGQYEEAGKIFEDAGRRFTARDRHFPAVAFIEAANAYALAGDLTGTSRALDLFDALDAPYVGAAYRTDVVRLRRLAQGTVR